MKSRKTKSRELTLLDLLVDLDRWRFTACKEIRVRSGAKFFRIEFRSRKR